MRPRSSRSGLSLVQVLVSSAVLVVALLPLFTLLSGTVRTTEVSLDELRATLLAEELMEEIRLLTYQPGFHNLPDLPASNPPPFSRWVALHQVGGELFQKGARLPAPVGDFPPARQVETEGWTLLGTPVCQDRANSPGYPLESLSRLYLSPVPEGVRRYLKIHEAPLKPDGTTSPNLRRVEVRVEWDRTFLGSPTQTRQVQLTTLLGTPGGLP